MYPINLVETDISIHAPTRGATRSYLPVGSGVFISIHAPTRGATLMNFLTDVLYEFQSTLLQEERHVGNGYMYWISKISIHAPTRGATFCGIIKRQNQIISIHAPTRGATGCYFFVLKFPKISIHAPTRGATLPIIRDILFSAYFNPRSYKRSDSPSLFALSTIFHFNPRSYKRSDKNQYSSSPDAALFQSTLLQEERHCLFCFCFGILCISIHAPTRGATWAFVYRP